MPELGTEKGDEDEEDGETRDDEVVPPAHPGGDHIVQVRGGGAALGEKVADDKGAKLPDHRYTSVRYSNPSSGGPSGRGWEKIDDTTALNNHCSQQSAVKKFFLPWTIHKKSCSLALADTPTQRIEYATTKETFVKVCLFWRFLLP